MGAGLMKVFLGKGDKNCTALTLGVKEMTQVTIPLPSSTKELFD